MEQLSLLPDDSRTCVKCRRGKPADAFNWADRARGIRQRWCRDCFSVYNRQRYEKEAEQIKAAARAYRAENYAAVIARTHAAYWRDPEASRAKGRANAAIQNARPERRAAKQEWARQDRAANPEKWREKNYREYWRNPAASLEKQHARRARKLALTIVAISSAQLAAKWDYWGARCWMCGGAAVEWDHVKPLAKGGAHALANLRPACVRCNRAKSAKWPFAA